ncbi:MAG: hypothetical protein NT027_16250 [Proteobacteria bacterium]|nr:hypothetical protein [Pseudomonadota bacterium]
MGDFKLKKPIWDESDFSEMGWHDAIIWSVHPNSDEFEFLIDLDYIFGRIEPVAGETHYKFWVSPVTMVFENASHLRMDLESDQGIFEVSDLHMKDPRITLNEKFTDYNFDFELQNGSIQFRATGFKMFVRQQPTCTKLPRLTLKERGGINFQRKLASR